MNPYQPPASSSSPSPSSTPLLVEVLFSFRGRVRRRTFWKWNLSLAVIVVFVVGLCQPFLFAPVFRPDSPPALFAKLRPLGMVVVPAVAFLSIWIGSALGVKRLHDQGKSGYRILGGLVPLLGAIWVFVQCGCLRGTEGPNAYGPDPT